MKELLLDAASILFRMAIFAGVFRWLWAKACRSRDAELARRKREIAAGRDPHAWPPPPPLPPVDEDAEDWPT